MALEHGDVRDGRTVLGCRVTHLTARLPDGVVLLHSDFVFKLTNTTLGGYFDPKNIIS